MDMRGHQSAKSSKKKKNRSSGAVKEVSPNVANGDGYKIKSIGNDSSSEDVSLHIISSGGTPLEVRQPLDAVTNNDLSDVAFTDNLSATSNKSVSDNGSIQEYADMRVTSSAGQLETKSTQQIRSCHQAADEMPLPGSQQPPPPCLLKAYRDLQRQISSLTRLQPLSAGRASSAKALIHSAFDKLRAALNCRESELVTSVDEYQLKANGTLSDRLYMGHVLKSFVDGAHRMPCCEQEDLRAHIKRYVAERGIDQAIGSAECFTSSNIEDIIHRIRTFGLVESFSVIYSYTGSDLPVNAEGSYHFTALDNTDSVVDRQNRGPSKLNEGNNPNLAGVSCASDGDLLLGNVQHLNGQSSADRVALHNGAENTETRVGNSASDDNCERSQTNSELRSAARAASIENVDGSESNGSHSAGCEVGLNTGADDLVMDSTIKTNTADVPETHNNPLNNDILDAKSEITRLREDFCKNVHQDNVTSVAGLDFDPSWLCYEDDTVKRVAVEVGRLNDAALSTRSAAMNLGRGLIRLPSAEANVFANSYRCDYRGRGWRGSGGASMSVGRRYSGPSGYSNGSHHEQRDNHRYGGGGERGGYHSYHDGKSNGGHHHHTSQPSRRSISYTADNQVDEDGFILVTRGRHDSSGGHGRGGSRVRGSSGDSMSSKCYYGNESTYNGNRDGHKTHRGFHHGSQGNNLGAKRWN